MVLNPRDVTIAVVGLGYVGLPLAVSFASKFTVIGYDINQKRIEELASGHDRTLEVPKEELQAAFSLHYSSDPADLVGANVYIVTTPTPVDAHKTPDLTPILTASRSIAPTLNKGDLVIYESTVYPGATEDECAPVLERYSGLRLNEDFYLGYSPERINPGDKNHRFTAIMKVTSGSTPEIADFVDELYQSVVTAGTHKAPTIRVAESAKVIENVQRDVNIALINELAILFNRLGIDTQAVLDAAGTKWNFLPFRPGLVGGHCIGVDPYYLTHKAKEIGYHPELILAGRRINDSMGEYVASELVKAMGKAGLAVGNARVLILGLTFKENTPDLRNTRVIDIVEALGDYGAQVDAHDPWCDATDSESFYGMRTDIKPEPGRYDAVILAVPHREFVEKGAGWVRSLAKEGGIVYDLKSALPSGCADLTL
ncbi:nucleotide sugar dehydrogenase [Brachybacterium paraconglomeratum]|uniref:nucleotide sugar dehydrogenase n=1 Tax=Brachybacterium paraconglomeratum TaxID=173362 RepID=UPI0037F81177